MGAHLISYRGQNPSHAYNQNLLWRDGSTFVMDNHRAAAWCWAQVIRPESDFSIFHIDRHTDLLQARLSEWCRACTSIESLAIERYLEIEFALDPASRLPIFSWENYLPIFIKQREARMRRFAYLWHGIGDKPWFEAKGFDFYDAPRYLASWLRNGGPWIVNLDMDYFFTCLGNDVFTQILSDTYIACLGRQLKEARDAGSIECLTVAISPEMCGGWSEGIRTLIILCQGLEVPLPQL